MAKRKRLSYIEILLILAIIAVLVVWLLPRFLSMLDSKPDEIGTLKPSIGLDYSEQLSLSFSSNFRVSDLGWKHFSNDPVIKSACNAVISMPMNIVKKSDSSERKAEFAGTIFFYFNPPLDI